MKNIYLFKRIRGIYIYMRERESMIYIYVYVWECEQVGVEWREMFSMLNYSINDPEGQKWATLKPEPSSKSLTWVQAPKVLVASLAAFTGVLVGNWIGSRAVGELNLCTYGMQASWAVDLPAMSQYQLPKLLSLAMNGFYIFVFVNFFTCLFFNSTFFYEGLGYIRYCYKGIK